MQVRQTSFFYNTIGLVNHKLKELSPIEIIIYTISLNYLFQKARHYYQNFNFETNRDHIYTSAYQIACQLPFIGSKIKQSVDNEIISFIDNLRKDITRARTDIDSYNTLHPEGLSNTEILKRFNFKKSNEAKGRHSGAIYAEVKDSLDEILREIYSKTAYTNPMHNKWPEIKLCEAETLEICHKILNSPRQVYIKRLKQNLNKQYEIEQTCFEMTARNMETIKRYEQKINKQREILNNNSTQENALRLEQSKKELKAFKKECLKNLPSYFKYQSLQAERIQLEKKLSNPGIITQGGTISIVEACFAYARKARERGIQIPVLIAPETAHAAFSKAAEYLNFRIEYSKINPQTGQADPEHIKQLIQQHGTNVMLVAASAPSFMYGIMDPIPAIAKITKAHNIPLHVDACLGGFLTAFHKSPAHPACDFSVPGVSSISLDPHKYGQTPKGSSILVFHPDTDASTVHCKLKWRGGFYATQGIPGSDSGAKIATTWAVLQFHGANFYQDEAKHIVEMRIKLEAAISKIDGLKFVYPDNQYRLNVIGIKSHKDINLLVVQEKLNELGWHFQIMQTPDQQVEGLHFCITSVHIHTKNFIEDFTQDLTQAFAYAKQHPYVESTGTIEVYGKMKTGIPLFVQQQLAQAHVDAHNSTMKFRR